MSYLECERKAVINVCRKQKVILMLLIFVQYPHM